MPPSFCPSSVKLKPAADLLRGDMTADEMRKIIRQKLVAEGLLPPAEVVEHQGLGREEVAIAPSEAPP